MTCRCAPEIKQTVVYFVLADFGRLGMAWVERDIARTNYADTLADIRSGELRNVVQVIETEFGVSNVLGGPLHSRDVTDDMLAAAAEVEEPAISVEEWNDARHRLQAIWDHKRKLRAEAS